jgi:hypothetical protein
MELRFKGQFNRDIDISNRYILEEVEKAKLEVKKAKTIAQISNLIKLRKYTTLYRIKIDKDYRIGIVIRDQTVWFVRFGHRHGFYKKFP